MALHFQALKIKDFLNPLYNRVAISETKLKDFSELFKDYQKALEANASHNEDALVANALAPFLKSLGFDTHTKFKLEGKSEIDLALLKDESVEVIIEAKKPNDKDFFSPQKPICKALCEAILYYFRQRGALNFALKFIIITDFYRFYFFEAKEFERLFYQNSLFKKLYANFTSPNSLFKGNTDEFYKECAKLLESQNFNHSISKAHLFDESANLKGLYLDIGEDKALPQAFKVFNKELLYAEFNPNDANVLNEKFYRELLYILGLSESKEKGKALILPSKESEDKQGTLYNAIYEKLSPQNQSFENVMKLIILWLNRILFLKLIESNLVRFNIGSEIEGGGHTNKQSLKFLNLTKIKSFDSLCILFFEVLAKNYDQRQNNAHSANLSYLPYLNSSLFEKQNIEKELLSIENLDDYNKLEYYPKTQIKDQNAKAKSGQVGLLEYIFEFLDAFDFGSDEDERKELISSSVLGLVFEKLNGYKEGSFYTPSFITAYMSKQSLEKVVVAKFNEAYPKWNALTLQDINEEIRDSIRANRDNKDATRAEYKKLLQSIKICDPAVGSGHFLVSCLNEMIYIYYELGLLAYIDELSLVSDELLIKTKKGEHFIYTKPNKANDEAQLIQKELFELKKTIIENNLFGVDINENSCEITKLRLWIELLKNSYYLDFEEEYKSEFKNTHQLATLPNIDINIKCGNSLIARFNLEDKFTSNNIKKQVKDYKALVKDYKDPQNAFKKIDKQELLGKIKTIKQTFTLELKDPKTKEALRKAVEEHFKNFGSFMLDDEALLNGLELGYSKNIFSDQLSLSEEQELQAAISFGKIKLLRKKLDDIQSGAGFENAFEWRFAFPEILDDEGNFTGFDLIIGNPPYIRQEEIKELKPMLAKNYKVYKGTSDIYTYFFELGFRVLKDKGILSFITSNKYTRAGYGEALREFLLKNTSLLAYIDLNSVKVFDSATVDTSILSFSKVKPAKDSHFAYLALNNELLEKCKFNISLTQDYASLEQKSLSKESFSFNDEKTNALKAKIEKIGTPLKEWDISINYGIKTGYNEAFIIDTTKKDEILANCKDEAERQRTSQLIKPILRGRDIKRYSYEWAGLWVIFIPWHFPNINNPKTMQENEQDLANLYPALYAHLLEHKEKLSKRNKAETGIRYEWYCLQRWGANYYEEFAREKIVYPNMASEFVAVLDKQKVITNQKCFILTSDTQNSNDLLYLTGILNSKPNFWYFKQIGATLGAGGYEMSKIFVEKLPIPKINSKQEQVFITMVKELLELKNNPNWGEQDAKEKRILELETSLDEMVCELYKLNEAERKYIHTHTHTHK